MLDNLSDYSPCARLLLEEMTIATWLPLCSGLRHSGLLSATLRSRRAFQLQHFSSTFFISQEQIVSSFKILLCFSLWHSIHSTGRGRVFLGLSGDVTGAGKANMTAPVQHLLHQFLKWLLFHHDNTLISLLCCLVFNPKFNPKLRKLTQKTGRTTGC